ncbi:MAG: glycosyltransferase [Candidatus Izemoplasmataceae bacterium]
MRIGLFTEAYYPIISGVSVSVDNLAIELSKLGHEVIIFTNEHEHAKKEDKVIRFNAMRLPFKGMREYRIAKVTNKMIKEVMALKLDIVHCHTEFTMGRLGMKVAKRQKLPIVHTYHTMYEDYVHFISKYLTWILKPLAIRFGLHFANRSNAVIFPTIKVAEKFKQYGYKKNYHIIPTGIYLDRFQENKLDPVKLKKIKDSFKQEKIHLIYIGRVSREKNLDELFKAYQTCIIDHQLPYYLTIVGDGPDAKRYKDFVQKNNLTNAVTFVGMISPLEVGYYYHIGDIFVNFSQSETQGLTFIEAIAAGKPVLAKYDTHISTFIKDDYNGWIFKTKDSFIEKLKWINKNQENLSTMRKNCEDSAENFSAKMYALNIEKVYQNLIKMDS